MNAETLLKSMLMIQFKGLISQVLSHSIKCNFICIASAAITIVSSAYKEGPLLMVVGRVEEGMWVRSEAGYKSKPLNLSSPC